MPFTPAHVAAVLPGLPAARRWRAAAVPALVIGSMAPDAPYVFPLPIDRAQSHAWLMAPTLVALLSLVVTAGWIWGLAPAARALAPEWVARRVGPARRPQPADLGPAYVLTLIGILTHLTWDAATHPDGDIMRLIPALSQYYGRWPLFHWLQLLSGGLGVVITAAVLWRSLSRRAPGPLPVCRPWWQPAALPLMAIAIAAGALYGSTESPNGDLLHDMGWYVTTRAMTAMGLAAVGLAAAWWLTAGRRHPDG